MPSCTTHLPDRGDLGGRDATPRNHPERVVRTNRAVAPRVLRKTNNRRLHAVLHPRIARKSCHWRHRGLRFPERSSYAEPQTQLLGHYEASFPTGSRFRPRVGGVVISSRCEGHRCGFTSSRLVELRLLAVTGAAWRSGCSRILGWPRRRLIHRVFALPICQRPERVEARMQ
jgi:hypothetical protein